MPLKGIRLGMFKKQRRPEWAEQSNSTGWPWEELDLVGLSTQDKELDFHFLKII